MTMNEVRSARDSQTKIIKGLSTIAGAITLCGFALSASAAIYSDNVQSTNAALSDCVALNVSKSPETVTKITIWYYDEQLHPHVLTETTSHLVVQPGDAVFIQDGYSVPRSEGFRVPSTSCAVVTTDDAAFRAVFELRDTAGNTLINEPLR